MSSLGDDDLTRRDQPDISGEAGQLISGKFRLGSVLGLGAMGTVWSAYHEALDQTVAIKLIAKEYSQSREARHRFRVEATAAAKLRSRFVVQVYDSGETDEGLPYLVMEMLSGETLERRLDHGPVPLEDVVRITAMVARGLSLAHQQGIVHRDLKPANIFLAHSEDDGGEVAKVLDFGIAKVSDVNQNTSTTRTGTVLGTPQFMSPEQVRGLKSVDSRADIYSLGMVVYNMLTGRLAFEGEAFGDLLLTICTKDLPSVHDAAKWLPRELDVWFYRCCARDPDDRYQTADEAAEALLEASGLGGSLGSLNTIVAGGNSIVHGTLSGSVPPPRSDMATLLGTGAAPAPPGPGSAPPPPLPTAPRYLGTIGTSSVMDVGPASRALPRPRWIGVGAAAALLLGFGGVWLVRTLTTPSAEPTAAAAQTAGPATALPSVGLPPVEISATADPKSAPAGEPAEASDAGVSSDAGKEKPKVSPTWKGFQKKPTEPDLGF
ncbi:MAG: serine/threonine protein kinase [Polyangiaceae bacterium]